MLGASLLVLALLGLPPEDADFTLSKDPTRVVLHITVTNMMMRPRSATFYGDGRVMLVTHLGSVATQRETRIDPAELEELMGTLVESGLAEWDGMEISSRILAQRGGIPYLPPEDGYKVQIMLALESYSRAGFKAKNHERSIRISSPRIAAKTFSETIPEFQAVADLVSRLYQMTDEARDEE